MIVRSHLPWPLRWAFVAVMLGFSAALALWAFEFGREIAGLDRSATEELAALRVEVMQLRAERDRSISAANTFDSLLRAERTAQDGLAAQVRALEADNLELKNDLGFYERLLPAAGTEGPTIRAFQADAASPGTLRYRVLLMQAAPAGRSVPEFAGRYELTLAGSLDGAPWTLAQPGGAQPLQLKQVLRVEGSIAHPQGAVIKTATVRILDDSGAVRAAQSARVQAP